MRQRCNNPCHIWYGNYGGRGIKVCDRWALFINFLIDMGPRPSGKTIDRIKKDKGYCKSNCQWATDEEQNNNTRQNIHITYNGMIKTISQWARWAGLNHHTLRFRIKEGWPIHVALTAPANSRKADYIDENNEPYPDWAMNE